MCWNYIIQLSRLMHFYLTKIYVIKHDMLRYARYRYARYKTGIGGLQLLNHRYMSLWGWFQQETIVHYQSFLFFISPCELKAYSLCNSTQNMLNFRPCIWMKNRVFFRGKKLSFSHSKALLIDLSCSKTFINLHITYYVLFGCISVRSLTYFPYFWCL